MSLPIPEERLIELILDRGPDAARELAALRSDAASAARIATLEELLGAAVSAVCATELAPERDSKRDSKRERDLAERILARTTREDLSWRGDLRLVANHVKDRMRESRFTRFIAALLLGNLTIGPVVALAWVVTHEPEPERELRFHVEPVGDLLPAPEENVLAPLEADPASIDGVADLTGVRSAAQRDNLLRRARYLLAPAHGAVPASVSPELEASAPTAVRLLDARARLLAGGAWPSWLDDLRWEGEDDLLSAALHAEILLDRFALEGVRAPRFHPALEHLKRSVSDASDGPLRRLGEHALQRAAGYGTTGRAAGAGPLDPLDAAWRADLARALGAAASEPHAAGWLGPER